MESGLGLERSDNTYKVDIHKIVIHKAGLLGGGNAFGQSVPVLKGAD